MLIDKLSDITQKKLEVRLGFLLSGKAYQAALAAYSLAGEEYMEAFQKTLNNPWRQLSQFEQRMSSNNPAVKAFINEEITWSEMYGALVTVTGASYTRSKIHPDLFEKEYRFSDLKNVFTKSQAPALIFSKQFVPGRKDADE